MNHGMVPDGTIVAHRQRVSRIDVEHAIILNVAAFTDLNQLVVCSQHCAEPDARFAFQPNSPDQYRRRRGPALRGKFWASTIKREDWHSSAPGHDTGRGESAIDTD